MEVSLDFESRSTVNLLQTGVYPYALHPTTSIWNAAFAIDSWPIDRVMLWSPDELDFDSLLSDEFSEEQLKELAADKTVAFRAWNAQFERVMWREIMVRRHGFPPIELERWTCTAAESAAQALPRRLEAAAHVLGITEQKDKVGGRLMLQMAKPRKINPDGSIIWWSDYDRKKRLFDYGRQDVRTERGMKEKVRRMTEQERKVWLADQRINDRGLLIDTRLASAMRHVATVSQTLSNARLSELTNGLADKVSARNQIVGFLNDLGVETDSIAKDPVRDMLARDDLPAAARAVLELRQEAGKSSISKLNRFFTALCPDDRIRGTLLYHGAGPGRWAGRIIQPQNFPARSKFMPDGFNPETFIGEVMALRHDVIDLSHPVLEVLALMLKSCIIAAPGHVLMGCDFSQIEARVVAWLAGEHWLLEAFATGGKVYELMACDIYNVALDAVTKMARQLGKQIILGGGFGMGAVRFQETCAKYDIVIAFELAQHIVKTYRAKVPAICALWKALEKCAVAAVKNPGQVFTGADGKLKFTYRGNYLWMILPSGMRALAYYRAHIVRKMTPWGDMQDCVRFWGEDSLKRWVLIDLWGGLITENATQAIARDLMAQGMLRLEAADYPVVLTVHDEVVAEPDEAHGSLNEYTEILCAAEPWAAGCPIAAEGWVGPRLRK